MSMGVRQYICMHVQACTYYTGVLKNPAHILYATSKKSRTHSMQFCQCSLRCSFVNAVLHFQNAIAVLTFPEGICSLRFPRSFCSLHFPGAFSDSTFPGRLSGGAFRFEFSWWDFPGGFSGRKIAWTISTCKVSCTKTW